MSLKQIPPHKFGGAHLISENEKRIVDSVMTTTYTMTAEKLAELAATPIPEGTLQLIKDADPKDAAQIGWANCFQMFEEALKPQGRAIPL